MSKALWSVIGIVVGLWLLLRSGGDDDLGARLRQGHDVSANVYPGGRYGGGSSGRIDADDEAEALQAKEEFESAADDLRIAVNGLRHNDWRSQMSQIGSRLSDAEDALSELERLRPNGAAVQSARDEIDQMRSHMSRLHYENWRQVAPDLSRSSAAIEEEATAVSVHPEEE